MLGLAYETLVQAADALQVAQNVLNDKNQFILALAERVCIQSELLSRKAEVKVPITNQPPIGIAPFKDNPPVAYPALHPPVVTVTLPFVQNTQSCPHVTYEPMVGDGHVEATPTTETAVLEVQLADGNWAEWKRISRAKGNEYVHYLKPKTRVRIERAL